MSTQLRGVNLGGWLVLERWITPSVFKSTMAKDETQLCVELGENKRDRLETHRRTFITEDDIAWIKQHGLNAVRLPVPHWIFSGEDPYVPCVTYVDWLMDITLKHKLQVVLDFHAAPGSQNGSDHSGQSGKTEWHSGAGHITKSLDIISQLAQRYCKYQNLAGIELLNEPSSKIPDKTLLEYFRLGYERIRQYCDESVAVIISDKFNPLDWKEALTREAYTNTWLDTHFYQCFSREDKRRGILGNIKKAKNEWGDVVKQVESRRPIMIGEWSLSLDQKSFRGLDEYERDKAIQAYGRAQLEAFNQSTAWFYWTYKTEDTGTWNFRDSVQRGWLDLNGMLPVIPTAP